MRARDERGAAMVEMALILPLVLLLTFGLLDLGMAFNDDAALHSTARSGARIGSALSRDPLQFASIVGAVNDGMSSVSHFENPVLKIYKANGSTDVPDPCAPGDVLHPCVQVAWDNATDQFVLPPGFVEPAGWNEVTQAACAGHADKLGVTIDTNYTFLIGIPFTDTHMTATTFMDLEPKPPGSCDNTT